jgi:hypothetical protein
LLPGYGDASACLKFAHPGDPPRPITLSSTRVPAEFAANRSMNSPELG